MSHQRQCIRVYLIGFSVSVLIWTGVLSAVESGAIRALAPNLPEDVRLEALRTLDDYFPFHAIDSPRQWQERAEALRRRLRVATGLWPWPTRPALDAVITGCVEREGYTVEKVCFQSWPGHYVTGSLYRPRARSGPCPAVLSPHGHWTEGRFHDNGEAETRAQIAIGAERFEVGGRHPLQARCVQLVRMGCVVFHYDMSGYADSQQLDHRLGVRDRMNTRENWGLLSPQAELRLQNLMGLQTWNSIRTLDYVASLPDVDPQRIAVTGASGGGTQTFMLCALDQRPAVAFPAVMVSTAMQGGCVCENAPYLRIDCGNIDIAALTAPRPLGMTGANDWTVEIATKGLPDLQRLYSMLGAGDRVKATPLLHFEHNYNSVSRTVMYSWLNTHLRLGFTEPVIERDYVPLMRDELSVWSDNTPKPQGYQAGDAHERALVAWQTEDAEKQIAALVPENRAQVDRFREVVGGAFDILLGRRLADVGQVSFTSIRTEKRDTCQLEVGLLNHSDAREQLPAIILHAPQSRRQVTLWIDAQGKQGLFAANGEVKKPVQRLLQNGHLVMGVDLLYQGEFLTDQAEPEHARLVRYRDGKQAWQEFAGYTFGYNHSLFAQRVHDILSVIRLARDRWGDAQINLAGFGPCAGPLVAAARCQAGDAVHKAALATGGFRFASLNRFDHPAFLPGAVKYLDLPGLLALGAPHAVCVVDETDRSLASVRQTYRAAEGLNALTLVRDQEAAMDWLMAP